MLSGQGIWQPQGFPWCPCSHTTTEGETPQAWHPSGEHCAVSLAHVAGPQTQSLMPREGLRDRNLGRVMSCPKLQVLDILAWGVAASASSNTGWD